MTLFARAAILLALGLTATAQDVSGVWKARFLGADRPLITGEITFRLAADGKVLTGEARMGNWPGSATITEGTAEGAGVAFTFVGTQAWRAGGPGSARSGYPRYRFEGVIESGKIRFKVTSTNVMIYGEDGAESVFELEAERVP